jgi:hypothetical protein
LRYLGDTLELGQCVAAEYSFNVITIIIEPRQTGLAITLGRRRGLGRMFSGDTLPNERVAELVKGLLPNWT